MDDELKALSVHRDIYLPIFNDRSTTIGKSVNFSGCWHHSACALGNKRPPITCHNGRPSTPNLANLGLNPDVQATGALVTSQGELASTLTIQRSPIAGICSQVAQHGGCLTPRKCEPTPALSTSGQIVTRRNREGRSGRKAV